MPGTELERGRGRGGAETDWSPRGGGGGDWEELGRGGPGAGRGRAGRAQSRPGAGRGGACGGELARGGWLPAAQAAEGHCRVVIAGRSDHPAVRPGARRAAAGESRAQRRYGVLKVTVEVTRNLPPLLRTAIFGAELSGRGGRRWSRCSASLRPRAP